MHLSAYEVEEHVLDQLVLLVDLDVLLREDEQITPDPLDEILEQVLSPRHLAQRLTLPPHVAGNSRSVSPSDPATAAIRHAPPPPLLWLRLWQSRPGMAAPAHLPPEGGALRMVVSMRPMSAGEGYKYLLKSVVAGDGERSLRMPLTRYYAKTGTPPGHWLGSGVVDLGVFEGSEVTERQLELLLGQGRHPRTGEQLGRAYPGYAKGTGRTAVAGFDFTFSVPKSASILWAVADASTQEKVVAAHHAAIRDVLAFMEREVAATRIGASVPGSGAVAQADVTGLIATAYDHFDSRAGDPHLHTHVVVSNKVRGVADGRWRSLDSVPCQESWTLSRDFGA